MEYIGQGIAFASLVFAAAWLEINNKNADGLWFFIVIMMVLMDWHK